MVWRCNSIVRFFYKGNFFVRITKLFFIMEGTQGLAGYVDLGGGTGLEQRDERIG